MPTMVKQWHQRDGLQSLKSGAKRSMTKPFFCFFRGLAYMSNLRIIMTSTARSICWSDCFGYHIVAIYWMLLSGMTALCSISPGYQRINSAETRGISPCFLSSTFPHSHGIGGWGKLVHTVIHTAEFNLLSDYHIKAISSWHECNKIIWLNKFCLPFLPNVKGD